MSTTWVNVVLALVLALALAIPDFSTAQSDISRFGNKRVQLQENQRYCGKRLALTLKLVCIGIDAPKINEGGQEMEIDDHNQGYNDSHPLKSTASANDTMRRSEDSFEVSMEAAKLKTADLNAAVHTIETHQSPRCDTAKDNKLHSTKKLTYTFSTQPLETDLKKLLIQVTGEIDPQNITEVKLKVVSGQAGLHRLSYYTPRLRILTLDGSCISSFRDLGSSLVALTTLSVASFNRRIILAGAAAVVVQSSLTLSYSRQLHISDCRCNMKHLDGVSGFRNLQELNVRENFVSDPSPCSSVENLMILDLSRNQITDVSYFAFLRSCRKLRELRVTDNQFSDYKEEIRTLLPQLRILDGEEFEDCLQPEAAIEEGFLLNTEEPSSDDGSSTSLSPSVEMIDHKETKILREEDEDEKEEEEEEEETVYQPHPSSNHSDVSNNGDKITTQEIPSGKLSSGRVICGNLAVSLRARNPTKNPTSAIQLQIKDDIKLREDERNQKDC